MTKVKLSIDRLREVLVYDPVTGIFTWRVAMNGRMKAGDRAGRVSPEGYIQISIDGKIHQANQLAWAHQAGEWPSHLVDHKDRDCANNTWLNLREATKSQNGANAKIRNDNSVGLKGVSKNKWGFKARIQFEGRRISLGTHPTPETAHAAYVAKAKELFGEFARAA